MHDHIVEVCEHDTLQTDCANSTKFTTYVQLGDKDEPVRFCRQKVKDHDDSEMTYGEIVGLFFYCTGILQYVILFSNVSGCSTNLTL